VPTSAMGRSALADLALHFMQLITLVNTPGIEAGP
jgi:hypothetical protein